MSYADHIFINMCKDIIENGTSTEGEKVRPKWEDGTSAYTIKQFGVVNRYDLSKEFPALTLRRTAIKSCTDDDWRSVIENGRKLFVIFSRFSFGFFCNKKQKSEKLHSVESPFLGCGLIYDGCFCGSCARMIAANMITHPRISFALNCCPRRTHPARTEMQDSRLRIRDATVGFMFFCPMICRV